MGLYHHIGGEAGSKGKYWHPKRRLVGKHQRREKRADWKRPHGSDSIKLGRSKAIGW